MSVFRGSITEYPGVIVDHFTAFNCERGRIFFLSHCHKDHMTGLGSAALLSALHRRNAKLYCTEVTRSLLLSNPEFTRLAPFLHGLPTDDPVSMSLEAYVDCKAMNFTVTLLPAGHCPGSAMFLFQGSMGNVLYTGDFRLSLEETKRLRSLYSGQRPMDITTLYLDTTFCNPIATNLPSREVSRDHVLRLTERWLSENPRNVIHLQCAMFGYEHIFMAVAKKFNTKIHIAAWRLNAYSEIPAVAQCLTTDGESTRIHCCKFRKGTVRRNGLPCGSRMKDGRPPNVITIKPSTQWFLFSNKTITQPYVFLPQCNGYRVLHSMHASYSELSSFVAYLQPKTVVPCVVPFGDSTLTDVHARLKALLPDSKVGTRPPEAASPCLLPNTEHISSETAVRKRGRTTASAAVGVDGASSPCSSSESDSDWSSGDDTIDEFPSSEEPTSQKVFTATTNVHSRTPPLPKHLALPSMLTCITPSAPADQQPSSSPSDSVTVGSLQQTPLDLSLDSARSEQEDADSTITGSNKEAPKGEGFVGGRVGCGAVSGNDKHVTMLALPQVSRERPGEDGTHVPPEQRQVEGRFKAAGEFSDDLSGEEEWCLTLDASTEEEGEEEEREEEEGEKGEEVEKEEKREETVKGLSMMEDCKTPVAKRRRTDQEREEKEGEKGEEEREEEEGEKGEEEEREEEEGEKVEKKEKGEEVAKGLSRMEDCKTPVAKRRRTDHDGYTPAQDKSHDNPKPALRRVTRTPRRLFHCGVVTMVTEEGRQADTVGPHLSEAVIEYIDLTVEDEQTTTTTTTTTTMKKERRTQHDGSEPTVDKGHQMFLQLGINTVSQSSQIVGYHKSSTPCGDGDTCPEVIVLSDSPSITNASSQQCPGDNDSDESSVSSSTCPLGSPLFLPPTPGREGVESILNRRSIAF